jgi:hypothetical protein
MPKERSCDLVSLQLRPCDHRHSVITASAGDGDKVVICAPGRHCHPGPEADSLLVLDLRWGRRYSNSRNHRRRGRRRKGSIATSTWSGATSNHFVLHQVSNTKPERSVTTTPLTKRDSIMFHWQRKPVGQRYTHGELTRTSIFAELLLVLRDCCQLDSGSLALHKRTLGAAPGGRAYSWA